MIDRKKQFALVTLVENAQRELVILRRQITNDAAWVHHVIENAQALRTTIDEIIVEAKR